MNASGKSTTIALDAMGGDNGVDAMVEGAARALKDGAQGRFILFGDKARLDPLVAAHPELAARCEVRHADGVVSMSDKPSHVLRRGRDTSMWAAVAAAKDGEADAVVSCGNTGALMAVSRLQLRMIEGVSRPAISAMWPRRRGGRSVVLDVGANIEVDAEQLVQFAIMGEAYYRAMTGVEKPSVGLLNVGAEELKGSDLVRAAARILREADPEMNFRGFVEGNDISFGTVDVIVTDGFSGNIALKSAEGAARVIGDWLRELVKSSPLSLFGALFMAPALRTLKNRMDPSAFNGGVFLGLKGLVIKSHGGADEKGAASAILLADKLSRHPFREDIAETVAKVAARHANVHEQEDIAEEERAAS